MNLQTIIWQIIIKIRSITSLAQAQTAPLINQGGENIVDVGVVLVAIGLVLAMRILSPKVEHAIFLAIFLSITLMAFFFIK